MEHFKQRQPLANDRALGWTMKDPPKPVSRLRNRPKPEAEEAGEEPPQAQMHSSRQAPAA